MLRSRIMYIEDKSDQLVGLARIGRVTFSKMGKSLYYKGRIFQSLKGSGFKANYFDVDSGDRLWISGPKKNGADGLYGRAPRKLTMTCETNAGRRSATYRRARTRNRADFWMTNWYSSDFR